MTTKLIGLKEFRLNLASYTKEVESKKVRLIVLKKNKPILEINPINIKEFTLENLRKDVGKARKQVQNGDVYTLEEAKRKLGLK
jgi:PHD/YefM family antitoxin component YafN of YafNO toxin-antitoxin module